MANEVDHLPSLKISHALFSPVPAAVLVEGEGAAAVVAAASRIEKRGTFVHNGRTTVKQCHPLRQWWWKQGDKANIAMMMTMVMMMQSCHPENCRQAGHMQQRHLFHRCCFWHSYPPRGRCCSSLF